MKKLQTRAISLLLSLVMIVSLLPTTVWAADMASSITQEEWDSNYYTPAELAGYSFEYAFTMTGGDVAYAYFLKRVPNPEGTGMMNERVLVVARDKTGTDYTIPDYDSAGDAPWGGDADANKLFIEAGITEIGAYAFSNMPSLTSVTLGDSSALTYVGKRAFSGNDRAVFADAKSGAQNVLDLSNVTSMGEYAFASCAKLTSVTLGADITAVETGEGGAGNVETQHKLPKGAFSGCANLNTVIFADESRLEIIGQSALSGTALTGVTVPSGVREIEQSAFSGLSKMNSLVLPDSLETIGERAFYCNTDVPNEMLNSLTIPEHVKTIEKEAFCNFKSLSEVIVESEVLEDVAEAAFGNGTHNAYSAMQNGALAGAQFKTPNSDISEKFKNAYNCYMGAISPLTLIKEQSYPADCEKDGKNVYSYEFNGEKKTLEETLQSTGIHKIAQVTISATCTQDAYYKVTCDNHYEQDQDGNWIQTPHTHKIAISIGESGYEPAHKHNYTFTEFSSGDGKLDATQGVTIVYTCQNGEIHDDEVDRPNRVFLLTLPKLTRQLTGTTASGALRNTLASVSLPVIADASGPMGALTWKDPNQVLDYQEGVQYYTAVFTPDKVRYANTDGLPSVEIQVGVKVNKAALNFYSVRFNYVSVNVDPNAVSGINIEVAYAPDGAQITQYLYTGQYNGAESYTGSQAPVRNRLFEGNVEVTFGYDPNVYTLSGGTEESGYTIDTSQPGTVKISHAYSIVKPTMDKVRYSIFPGLRYNGTAQKTIHLSEVPSGSKVEWTWVMITDGAGNPASGVQGSGVLENSGSTGQCDVAELTQAGSYRVSIVVSNDEGQYEDYKVDNIPVTIDRWELAQPVAVEGLVYTPESVQTGVADSNAALPDDAVYTISGHQQTNADRYTALAEIADGHFANYCWAGQDGNLVSIPWSIGKRSVLPPSYTIGGTTRTYDAAYVIAVTRPTGTLFEYEYDEGSGVASGYYGQERTDEYKAFTVSFAKMKDAGTYAPEATLTDSSNYAWLQDNQQIADESIPLGKAYTILKAALTAPSLTADSAEYTGEPYDEDAKIHRGEDPHMLGSDSFAFVKYQYYASGIDTPSDTPPVNQGSYTVEAVYDYPHQNYRLTDSAGTATTEAVTRAGFQITPITLTFDDVSDTRPYTGAPQAVPVPTLKNPGSLVADEEYTLVYSYSVEDKNGQITQITGEEPLTFEEVGSYTVSVQVKSGTNYTSAACTSTLTIVPAEQTVTLTPEEGMNWDLGCDVPGRYQMTAGLKDGGFTVRASSTVPQEGGAFDVSDQVDYSHQSDNPSVAQADSTGRVTIKGAGRAVVTVTASPKDQEHSNIVGSTASYILIVEKASPTIDTSAYAEGKFEAPYTGDPIEGYAKAGLSGVAGIDPVGELTYTFYSDPSCTQEVSNGGGASKNIPVGAGAYYLKVSYAGDQNYLPASSAVVSVRVTKAGLDDRVSVEDYSESYDGRQHSLKEQQVTVEGFSSDEYRVRYAGSATQPDAGDSSLWVEDVAVKNVADSTGESTRYWYMVTILDGNYEPVIGEIRVDITPCELNVEHVPESFEKEYDATTDVTTPLADISVTGVDGEDIMVSPIAFYDDKNIGGGKQVTLKLSLEGSGIVWGNYSYKNIPLTQGSLTLTEKTGIITEREIVVTGGIAAQNRVYDATRVVTLTGKPVTGSFAPADVEANAVSFREISSETGTVADADVGDGKTVTVSAETLRSLLDGDASANYTIRTDYTGATVDIDVRPVYLLFPGETTHDPDWSARVPYDTEGLTASPNVYRAEAAPADDSSGLVGGDALGEGDITYLFTDEGSATVKNPTDLGRYTVAAKLADEAKDRFSNYKIPQISGTVEIIQNADALTVDVTPKRGLVYNGLGQDPIESVTVQGGSRPLTEGADYTISYSLTEGGSYALTPAQLTERVKDAGQYTVYWKVVTTNYGHREGSFEVAVERAELSLDRDISPVKTYNGDEAADGQVTNVRLTGQKEKEDIRAELAGAAYDKAGVTAEKITVTYSLIAKDGAKLENYKVSIHGAPAEDAQTSMTEEVKASITAAPVEVTIQNQSDVYDGGRPEVDQGLWSADGTVYPGDDLKVVLSVAEGAVNVGSYDITGTAHNENYRVTFRKGSFEVTPRSVAVEIGSAKGTYGDVPELSGVKLSYQPTQGKEGLAPNERSIAGISLQAVTRADGGTAVDGKTDIGTYVIVGTDNSENYDIAFDNGSYTVERRPVTVTIANKGSLYGQDIAKLTSSVTSGSMANDEDLDIVLETDAVKGSDAGFYAIFEKSRNEEVADNYEVTVIGETAFGGEADRGTYTVGKASLSVSFKSAVLYPNFGRPVTNPVTFSNASVSPYETVADDEDLRAIAQASRYESSNPGAVSVDPVTGEVTLLAANATANIFLTVGDTKNFHPVTDPAVYTINVGSAGGYQPNFTPGTLTYNGEQQQLMTMNGTLPAGLSIRYSTDSSTWESDIAKITGINAGNYTVYWEISDALGNYGDSNGVVFVTIAKDILEDQEGFVSSSPSIVFSHYEGRPYENPLRLPGDYTGSVAFQGSNDTVATVQEDGTVTVLHNGTVTITATCPSDDNYQGRQYRYTLTVASSQIDYTSPTPLKGVYDGTQQASLTVPVTSSTAGAVVRYGVNTDGLSFPEETVPKIRDAGTYEIWYQVTAAGGYATVEDFVTAVISPKDIDQAMVAGISDSYTYSGNKITPLPVVTDRELQRKLTPNVDYTLAYGENTQVGPGSVTIAGMGNYGSSVSKSFRIEAVGGSEMTASLSEYFGSLDQHPSGTQTTVSVTHGSHDVGFVITDVSPSATVEDDGATLSFTDPGVYTITVKAGDDVHAEQQFRLTYMLMPKTSEGGFVLTFDDSDTRVVTFGQRLIPQGMTAGEMLKVTAGDGSLLTLGADYTLSCMYYDCLGSAGVSLTQAEEIPQAGMYVVTATGTGQYGSDQTGVFTLLVLQKNIGEDDIA